MKLLKKIPLLMVLFGATLMSNAGKQVSAAEITDPSLNPAIDWVITNYSSDMNVPVEKILRTGGLRPDTGINYASTNFFNIGNSTFTAKRTLELKAGKTYNMKFLYGLATYNNALGYEASGYIDFNGTQYTASKTPIVDAIHQEQVIAQTDQQYVITIHFEAPRDTGVFTMVAYDSSDEAGGIGVESTVKTGHIRYLDTEEKELMAAKTVTGLRNEAYTTNAEEIPGYELSETPTNAAGSFLEDHFNINYRYKKVATLAQSKVTAQFIDENKNEIAPSEVLEGEIGKNYTIKSKEIKGYKLVDSSAEITGTFGAEAKTVSFNYQQVATENQGVVHIKYLDEQGEEIAAMKSLQGQIGDKYTVTETEIEGYRLISDQKILSGVFAAKENTIGLVYKKASETVGGQINSQNNQNQSGTTNKQSGSLPRQSSKTGKQLPLTNQKSSVGVILTGSLLLIGAWFMKRQLKFV